MKYSDIMAALNVLAKYHPEWPGRPWSDKQIAWMYGDTLGKHLNKNNN